MWDGLIHRSNGPKLTGNKLFVTHWDSFGINGTSVQFKCPDKKCNARIGVYVNGENDYTASIPLYGSVVSIGELIRCESCNLLFRLLANTAYGINR